MDKNRRSNWRYEMRRINTQPVSPTDGSWFFLISVEMYEILPAVFVRYMENEPSREKAV